MRRDLDLNRTATHEKRAREFGDTEVQIGGEIFHLRVNAPYGVWMTLDDAGKSEGIDVFRKTEEAILMLVEPDEVDAGEDEYGRLKHVLRNEFTHDDLLDLMRLLTEEATARPSEAPNSSELGREPTGISSTDTSSSPPAAAQAN